MPLAMGHVDELIVRDGARNGGVGWVEVGVGSGVEVGVEVEVGVGVAVGFGYRRRQRDRRGWSATGRSFPSPFHISRVRGIPTSGRRGTDVYPLPLT